MLHLSLCRCGTGLNARTLCRCGTTYDRDPCRSVAAARSGSTPPHGDLRQPSHHYRPMSDSPPPISCAQRQARGQGVIAIGDCLQRLGEPGWRGALLHWLGQYEGLETYMDPEEDPVLAVADLLRAYVEEGQRLEPQAFSAELADLHFCYYRARRDRDRKKWEPLVETFAGFSEGLLVTVWQGLAPYPSRDLIQSCLLVRFCRAQLDVRGR